jgi:hypothetical protein
MKKDDCSQAQKVEWVDPSGKRMLLEVSSGGELFVALEYGAVTIRATNCLLTEFGSPGSTPDVRRKVDALRVTFSLNNCRIDWKM